ncbi:MAG: CDP-alcohol phosphatidyltransferase family protein [Chlamydiales bacterium]|nr:CDP-alcohol phosphatidyltransferase family protein [Chlamydiales bacterium]
MITISNSLSFLRAPLAFLFLQSDPILRLSAIALAMLTDCIDGYLARRTQSTTRFGAILDPAMDKFFVYFVLVAFLFEGQVSIWQAGAMLSRDVFLGIYGFLMLATNRWKTIIFRAIKWGKITTALQFIVLICLTLHVTLTWHLYMVFFVLGMLAFAELLQSKKANAVQ